MPVRVSSAVAPHDHERLGVIAATFAFVAWGILPVYWKALQHINSVELLAHRIVWTVVAAAVAVSLARRWREVRDAATSWRAGVYFVGAACFLGTNWYIFISAVNTGHVVECSLGYYINPLVNVLLGFLFLGERFRPRQLLAIALAAGGVLNLTWNYGRFPAIALALAVTFAIYSLIRKTAGYGSVAGLLLETALLLLPAGGYLAAIGPSAWDALAAPDWRSFVLVPGTGLVTAIPLVTFAFGARRIRLATVGFIQYLTPTGMFLLGVFLYREPFSREHLITFACIWIGLAIYSIDAIAASRRTSPGAR